MLNGRWVEAEDDEAREIQEEATINLGPTSAAIPGGPNLQASVCCTL